ncbi:uncharacterized protein BX664DRAFT_355165 [Halteromyces radiatus]|uniref:uncharacterized protein n=1 Tax=Halteromyces radiatus TaxID=101107 RepID=UPI002220C510|nr:uncharacterized protein BX664DRAFT_355165 [Halteromyces radiatus]KAI8099777.1 hypothetical protein BX664DRAFT_355165 [Halteromyces radiatus]
MTQQLRPKNNLHSFRAIAPSIAPATSWNINDLENRKRENPVSNDSPAKHFHNNSRGHSNTTFDAPDGMHEVLTADQKARRKEQNRAAQRAFRERKERYVKELETKIKLMEKAHAEALSAVELENQSLREKVARLEQQLDPTKKKDHDHDVDMTTSALEATTISGKESIQLQQKLDFNNDSSEDMDMQSSPTFSTSLPTTPYAPSSAVACIRDKDGISFCERLKEEVCSSAYNQLLSEPLFDASGSLNETITKRPVPIVTDRMDDTNDDDDVDDQHKFDMYDDPMYFLDRLTETLSTERFDLSSPHPDTLIPDVKLIPCSKVWKTLSAHPKFDAFDVDVLCDELKKIAKCSGTGPVFTEHELEQLVLWMEERTNENS